MGNSPHTRVSGPGGGAYAGVGTWLTSKIGRPLVPLNFARQRFEADFRFSLVRFRENTESVALYGGGRGEIRLGKGRILFVPQRPYLPSALWPVRCSTQVAINAGSRRRG
jgi:ABC transporter transmembrane region 2